MEIKGYCPYCHKEVVFLGIKFGIATDLEKKHFETYSYTSIEDYSLFKNENGAWMMGECPLCKNCVLIHVYEFESGKIHRHEIFPYPLPSTTDERIPEKIRKDLDEAKICLSVGAYRACAAMCRRAIQTACIDKGVDKNTKLDEQINELAKKGEITEHIKNWAHSIRWVGNDAVHPESPEVTESDAKDILNLTEQIMTILYIMPAISNEKNRTHGKKA
jgi:hypothetical protein